MEELGHSNFTVLQGSAREPIWPINVSGSISHSSEKVICAENIKRINGSVGIDIEEQIPYKQAKELWCKIINSSEYDLLCQQQQPFERLLTIVFSAKESLFKALYPMLKNYFYFLDTQIIEIDMKKNTFKLELLKNMHAGFCNNRMFEGVFRVRNNEIMTLIDIQ
ncbi:MULTISPECIES: 4'-phosphopantetheinyl transferase family protein [unclassified Brenneria]|uniref:4'-phosphopantetheinyl transferase family protein n=1 Tax=unclassified Brenneria TaxID=2634434 RepID=UPI0018F08D68|nr:4'-phosphopantetheinyl transferase superfamily protein [Brenneria sp. L3-3C-1]MBJ7224160.1 4'-phosphopantetheinyl transferase superfamily protein [Brenneria sp. L3-3C-1]MEE3645406.1 4'-phosphopantetheinyl transferase superfamily protein [Brenneria sp. L3_3C_1]